MPSKLWAVRSALVDIFDLAVDAAVVDGPMTKSSLPKKFVLVGSDGGDDGTGEDSEDGAFVEQALNPSSSSWRDETGEIVCSAWSWSGGTDFAPHRLVVAGLVDGCEAALAANRTLGGVLTPADRLAWFGGMRVREWHHSKGCAVRAVFTVSYTCLITT